MIIYLRVHDSTRVYKNIFQLLWIELCGIFVNRLCNPAGTGRNCVIITSKRRCNVFWRNDDVIDTSRARWDIYPLGQFTIGVPSVRFETPHKTTKFPKRIVLLINIYFTRVLLRTLPFFNASHDYLWCVHNNRLSLSSQTQTLFAHNIFLILVRNYAQSMAALLYRAQCRRSKRFDYWSESYG